MQEKGAWNPDELLLWVGTGGQVGRVEALAPLTGHQEAWTVFSVCPQESYVIVSQAPSLPVPQPLRSESPCWDPYK